VPFNDVSVNITTMASGQPATVLETADFIVAVGSGWNDVTFGTPQTVTAGVLYAIELIPLGPPGITWNGSCDAANYTRGEALVDATPWETVLALGVEASNPTTYCQTDYGFQEYIQDPAAPSPTAASQAPTSTVAPETRHWTTAPTSC
jgi:hypothetical protein